MSVPTVKLLEMIFSITDNNKYCYIILFRISKTVVYTILNIFFFYKNYNQNSMMYIYFKDYKLHIHFVVLYYQRILLKNVSL